MLTNQQKHEAEQSAEMDDETPERYAHWCNHRFGDGSSARRHTWTEKGYVTNCTICGEVIGEQ